MRINLFAFKGRIPIVSDRLLPDNNATIAKDCDLRSGEIRALHEETIVQDVISSKWKTIYKWFGQWLLFDDLVDVINSPVADDVWKRICWTGKNLEEPRMCYSGIMPGNGEMQGAGYKLGIPEPINKITVNAAEIIQNDIDEIYHERPIRIKTKTNHGLVTNELVQFEITSEAETGTGNDKVRSLSDYLNATTFQITLVDGKDDEFTLNNTDAANVKYTNFIDGVVNQYFDAGTLLATFYIFTYVSEIGEESPPCLPSEQINIGQTQKVTLVLPPTEPEETVGRNITRRRIYKSASGNNSAAFLFLAELPVTDETYVDETLVANLGELIPSVEYDPPNEKMQGLRVASQGFAVGFYDNVVCFSEPNLPHAWPTSYQIALDYEIVAIEIVDNGVVIGTTGRPYFIQGVDPSSMMPRRIENDYACISSASMVSLGYAAMYATVQGLVYVAGGQAQLITESLMTELDWAKYQPNTMKAFSHQGMYIGFYGSGQNKGGFVLNPRDPTMGLIEISAFANNGFFDPQERYLYLLVDNKIKKWNDDQASPIAFTWRSKTYAAQRPNNLSCAKVTAAAYPVTFRLYGDGLLKYEKSVDNANPFVLPAGYMAREWNIEVAGMNAIYDVQVADSYQELE